MVLGAFYLMWMLRRVVFGPLREPTGHGPGDVHADGHAASPAHCPPMGWHEIAGLAPLMFLIVAIGVYPRPIFEQIQPAVQTITRNLTTQRERSVDETKVAAARETAPTSAPGEGGAGRSFRVPAKNKTSKKGQ
jgi:NADH-quinone oxidoreductase subunit M